MSSRLERNKLLIAIDFFVAAGWIAAALVFGAQTIATQTSPDGLWRVELYSATTTTPRFELWSTSVVSGVRRRIGHVVPHDHDVFEFLISGDSARVVYRQGRTATGESHLYSTPIDRSAGALISPPASQGGRVGARITLEPGGHMARYRYAEQQGNIETPRIVSVAGGHSYRECFSDGFNGGTTGAWR